MKNSIKKFICAFAVVAISVSAFAQEITSEPKQACDSLKKCVSEKMCCDSLMMCCDSMMMCCDSMMMCCDSSMLQCGYHGDIQALSADTRENFNKDEESKTVFGPYLTNRFKDNWFVSLAGGVSSLTAKDNSMLVKGGLDITLGKWITPNVAIRGGFQGLRASEKYGNANFNQHSVLQPDANGVLNYQMGYIHGDVMFDLCNIFGGYKQDRTVSVAPYVHTGALFIGPVGKADYSDKEIAMGVGLFTSFSISDAISINLDLRDIFVNGRFHNYSIGGIAQALTANIGLAINFGGTTAFRRYSTQKSIDSAVNGFCCPKIAAMKHCSEDAE